MKKKHYICGEQIGNPVNPVKFGNCPATVKMRSSMSQIPDLPKENTSPLNKCARDTGRCKMQQFIFIRSFRHSVFSFEKKGGSK